METKSTQQSAARERGGFRSCGYCIEYGSHKWHRLLSQKTANTTLAAVAQWIESWPGNQRVTGSIPSLGHMPGLQVGPQWDVCERQPHIDVSLPLFLPPFPSL